MSPAMVRRGAAGGRGLRLWRGQPARRRACRTQRWWAQMSPAMVRSDAAGVVRNAGAHDRRARRRDQRERDDGSEGNTPTPEQSATHVRRMYWPRPARLQGLSPRAHALDPTGLRSSAPCADTSPRHRWITSRPPNAHISACSALARTLPIRHCASVSRRAWFLSHALFFAVAACSGGHSAQPTGTIVGRMYLTCGPKVPACLSEVPLLGEIAITQASSHVVVRIIKTDKLGRFRVTVPVGAYVLRGTPAHLDGLVSTTVSVHPRVTEAAYLVAVNG